MAGRDKKEKIQCSIKNCYTTTLSLWLLPLRGGGPSSSSLPQRHRETVLWVWQHEAPGCQLQAAETSPSTNADDQSSETSSTAEASAETAASTTHNFLGGSCGRQNDQECQWPTTAATTRQLSLALWPYPFVSPRRRNVCLVGCSR